MRFFSLFTKRWRHRIDSLVNRFQNMRTRQKEHGILCWRLLLQGFSHPNSQHKGISNKKFAVPHCIRQFFILTCFYGVELILKQFWVLNSTFSQLRQSNSKLIQVEWMNDMSFIHSLKSHGFYNENETWSH